MKTTIIKQLEPKEFAYRENLKEEIENESIIDVDDVDIDIDIGKLKELNYIFKKDNWETESSGEFKGKNDVYNSTYIVNNKNVEPVLGVNGIAKVLSEYVMKLNTEEGNIIGIFGKWGRGKTYLFKQIWNEFKNKNNITIINFKAWKYQDSPACWAYLYEVFSEKYFKKRVEISRCPIFINAIINFLAKYLKVILFNISRYGVNTITILLPTAMIFFYFILKNIGNLKYFDLLYIAVITFVGFISLIKARILNIPTIDEFTKRFSYKNILGFQVKIQEELKFLIKKMIKDKNIGKEKMLLFVDDIDRCKEEKMIELIDSLRIILDEDDFIKRLIIFIAIDKRMLKFAVEKKINSKENYENDSELFEEHIQEYIDKLFVLSIKLGALNRYDRASIFNSYIKNKVNFEFDDLIDKGIYENDEEVSKNENNENEKNNENKEELYDKNTKLPIEYIEKNEDINDLEDIKEEVLNSNYVLSKYEYSFIKENIIDMNVELTPRQIKILCNQYIIGKKFILFDGTLKMRIFIRLIGFIYNYKVYPSSNLIFYLGYYISEKVNFKNEERIGLYDDYIVKYFKEYEIEYFKNLEVKKFYYLLNIVNMIIPY